MSDAQRVADLTRAPRLHDRLLNVQFAVSQQPGKRSSVTHIRVGSERRAQPLQRLPGHA